MNLQVTLFNELSVGNINLKMCDAFNLTQCTQPIENTKSDVFPSSETNLSQVKISPTDSNLEMPNEWWIRIENTGVTHAFNSLDDSVIEDGKNDDEDEITLHYKNGTTNWELEIIEARRFRQPTNVTIGDN